MGLKLNDVEEGPIGEVGVGVGSSGKGGRVRPDRSLKIVLRILAASRKRIEIEPITGANHILRIE